MYVSLHVLAYEQHYSIPTCRYTGTFIMHVLLLSLLQDCIGVYGENEQRYLFKGVIVGHSSRARFKIRNTNKVCSAAIVTELVPCCLEKWCILSFLAKLLCVSVCCPLDRCHVIWCSLSSQLTLN